MAKAVRALFQNVVLKALPISIASTVGAIAAPHAIAQITAPAQPSDFITVCAYDPTAGIPNPLGMRTFISVREIEGNSIFRYQQLPAIVSGSGVPASPPADIEVERSLTLYETPIAEARQLMEDNPSYYASLLGVPVNNVGSADFAEVNAVLSCQDISGNIAGTPAPRPPAPTAPAPSPSSSTQPVAPTLAALPNGNYRMASAEFTNNIVSDEELLAKGGYLFTFRKFGNKVTGNFGHIDHERGACVTGTVSGNTITGEAYTVNEPTTIGGKTYLDPLGVLLLGNPTTGEVRYNNSVMNVEGLFQINAGTQIPRESCP